MQNSIPVAANNEVKEQNRFEDVLRVLPPELLGVLPEPVWASLSVDQKKAVLQQHGHLEKYVPSESNPTVEGSVSEVVSQTPDVVVQQAPRVENIRTPEFQSAVKEVERVEKDTPPVQDMTRIEAETAATSNKATTSMASKLFGYPVSEEVASQAGPISDTGSPTDGKTWAATLIEKALADF